MNRLQWKQQYREERLAKQEEWRDIPGYEGRYQASNLGNVRTVKYKRGNSTKILGMFLGKDGYFSLKLCINGIAKSYKAHRLVAQAFIPNPDNRPQVNHKNGIKTDNIVDNLEWCTASENMRHSFDVLGFQGSMKGVFGEKHHGSKIVEKYDLSGKYICRYSCLKEAGRETGISFKNISSVCRGLRKNAGGFSWKFFYM